MRVFDKRTLYGGLGTLNVSRSPLMVSEQDIVECNNLTYEHDNLEKAGGADKINTTAISGNPTIAAHHEFVSDAGVVEQVVYTTDGKLLVIDSSGISKTLATGIGTNRVGVFAEGSTGGNKRLFFVNGATIMLMYDGGASASAIANPPADWTTTKPTWIVTHEGRMWAGCDNHFIYGSVLNTHDDFINTGTVFFNVYPGEGRGVVGAASIWARLFLFKYKKGIYYLDDSDADFKNWDVKRHSRNVGSLGHRSIVEVDNDILFASPQGFIHALSTIQEFSDVETSAILPIQMGPLIRDNVDFTRGRFAQSMYHATKKKVMWGFTKKGSTVNNFIVGFDFHAGIAQGFSSIRDICETLSEYTDPGTELSVPVAGDDNGFLWKLDTLTFDKDGVAYEGLFKTDDIDLYPNGERRGNLKELEIVFDQVGDWNVTIDVIVDGIYRESKIFSLRGVGAVLGSFTLGQDKLGIVTFQNNRGRLHGDGRRVRLMGKNVALGETFRIVSKTVKYTPGNDK